MVEYKWILDEWVISLIHHITKRGIKVFVKFCLVGLGNTAIDAGVFFLMCDILGLNQVFSNVVSYALGALNSYILSSKIVYNEEKYSLKKYIKFMSGNFCILLVSTVLVMIFSKFFEAKVIGKLLSIPITLTLNFLFQRYIVFRESADKILKERELQ